MSGRKVRAGSAIALSLLMVSGFQQIASGVEPPAADPASSPPPGAAPADVEKGEMLRHGGSSYPRLVRLEHGPAKGRVLASMTTYVDRAGRAVIYQSDDDGRSFQQAGEIRDPEGENEKGMCCSTLYELPQRVGDMPAGTLLWAGTAGIGADADVREASIRLWRSDDQGRTWRFLSTIVDAPRGPGVWEPEFTVSEDGDLVAFYSDDGDPKHDQKMVQVRSRDGVNWTDVKETIKNDKFTVRPGMAGVRQLPDGTYVMVYEVCNYDPDHICTVHMRKSEDGWDWGDPYDLGTEITSDTGAQPLGTPTIAWAPGPGRNGRLLLAYQLLALDRGGLAPGNGRTLLVTDDPANPGKPWREMPAPVHIKYNHGNTCRNFSPSVVPTEDGESVIHVTTDFEKYIGGPCEAWFGVGPIDGGQAAQAPQQMDTRPGR
ncbi:BNR repeat protein [Saccharopolyspora erythraea NRRL 2338]|uniref:Bifunctional protein (Secreted sugar binding protein/sugar hydrolase) n=2 Tax=Saccharopolyspora erythraea TaxID=1836 RepID=A4FLZ6_SACEN|nr:sialidase family protein [Saccharopolyspora erythraea]PFG98710.1 BNR repeat protein [Saccharopolyspora erythraea NRRL 2338]QRK88722.1 exo-alpha-sialidase [Saccharopolyspora erythraea]CAM05071.1 bifunctional protein (secreted sugar binding protein/sugar hydrolase) [Saccharopolyspora erythraea NRRL 2338]